MALTEKQIEALCVRKDQTGHWTHLFACLDVFEFHTGSLAETWVAVCCLSKGHRGHHKDIRHDISWIGEDRERSLDEFAHQLTTKWCDYCNVSPCECAGYVPPGC